MTRFRVMGVTALILILALSVINTMVVRTSNRAPDDGYISLRYAENLTAGHGLRFNPGGERVEGFSSPLHVLGLAALIEAGVESRAAGQLSSLVPAYLALMVVGWWGWRRFGLLWGSLGALAIALSQTFSYWARSGMETSLFALLITLALVAAAEGRWCAMGLAAGLVAVTRPEGVLYLAPLFIHAAVVHRVRNRTLKELSIPALLAAGPFAAWFLFRMAYFRDHLPNTYYAKMDGLRSAQLARGWDYLRGFASLSEIQVLLIMLALAGILVLARRRFSTGSWQILGLGLVACTVFFILVSGGDWMNQYRFAQPTLPILVLLGAWAGRCLASGAFGARARKVVAAVLALVFVSQPARILSHDLRHPNYPTDRPLGLVEPWDDSTTSNLFQLGERMRGIAPAGATFALCPVGAFSLAWGGTVIDMLGLNDRTIARLPLATLGQGQMGHEKGNGPEVLARRPEFILLRNNRNPKGWEPPPPDLELNYLLPVIQIWQDPSFARDYEPFTVDIGQETPFTVYRRTAAAPSAKPGR